MLYSMRHSFLLFFFFFKSAQYSILCTCHIFFIRSSVDGHLGYFRLMAVVNRTALNMDMQICLQDPALSSLDIASKMGGMQQYFSYSV